jgi:hypothetical protein
MSTLWNAVILGPYNEVTIIKLGLSIESYALRWNDEGVQFIAGGFGVRVRYDRPLWILKILHHLLENAIAADF